MTIKVDESAIWEAPEWMDQIVEMMVRAEAPDPRDHESLLGEVVKPSWVRRLEELYLDSWRAYPSTKAEASPHKFGLKLGKTFGGTFAGFELLEEKPDVLRGAIDRSLAYMNEGIPEGMDSFGDELVELISDNRDEFVRESREQIEKIFRIVFRQRFDEIADFCAGFSQGFNSWKKEGAFENLENERIMMARVLHDRWNRAESAETIHEVSEMVLEGMRPERREFVKSSTAAMEAFEGNFRKLCTKIGLKKRGPGRIAKKLDSE